MKNKEATSTSERALERRKKTSRSIHGKVDRREESLISKLQFESRGLIDEVEVYGIIIAYHLVPDILASYTSRSLTLCI